MRIAGLIFIAMLVGGSGSAFAQSEPPARQRAAAAASQEQPEEVVVRGRRLTELRAEVELKREQAYLIFNDINSDDDFDVYCRKESRSGTNVPQEVCRAQFENRISRAAGQEYLQSLRWRCPGDAGVTQDCMFSNYSAGAIQAAQGVEGQLPGRREQMADEIMRLANENDEFAQSILDWYEANQRYDEARKQRSRRND